jgi:hypothetical protein
LSVTNEAPAGEKSVVAGQDQPNESKQSALAAVIPRLALGFEAIGDSTRQGLCHKREVYLRPTKWRPLEQFVFLDAPDQQGKKIGQAIASRQQSCHPHSWREPLSYAVDGRHFQA